MTEDKKKVIMGLTVRAVADRAGVSVVYIYSLLKGDTKASAGRSVQLADMINLMCKEYQIDASFTPADFNSDLDVSALVSLDTEFNVHSIAFSESRTLTAAELTARFTADRRLGPILNDVKTGNVAFASFGGCIIKRAGTF
ncbi:helix-turn-helix transcriptional regulator [uncultured Idiomarina sp.]|uniref:helix-turn-helix domain-containing protein n=1 Tax=uncultured Idiomarina sp. TaxID=352961 RepID=UPI0032B2EBA4